MVLSNGLYKINFDRSKDCNGKVVAGFCIRDNNGIFLIVGSVNCGNIFIVVVVVEIIGIKGVREIKILDYVIFLIKEIILALLKFLIKNELYFWEIGFIIMDVIIDF